MPNNYRIYRLDRANHVVEAEWIVAASDEEAVVSARAMPRPGKREIWQGERFVATVLATATEQPSSAFWL